MVMETQLVDCAETPFVVMETQLADSACVMIFSSCLFLHCWVQFLAKDLQSGTTTIVRVRLIQNDLMQHFRTFFSSFSCFTLLTTCSGSYFT